MSSIAAATPRTLRRRHCAASSPPRPPSRPHSASSLTKVYLTMTGLLSLESASGEGRPRRRVPLIVGVGLLVLPLILQIEVSSSVISAFSIYQHRLTETVSASVPTTSTSASASANADALEQPLASGTNESFVAIARTLAQNESANSNDSQNEPAKEEAPSVPIKKEEPKTIPVCYSDRASRFRPLQGDWKPMPGPPLYWKLSCPLEWSKFSCSHHEEAPERARESAKTRFVPRDCSFGSASTDFAPRAPVDNDQHVNLGQLAQLLRGRRILLFGDSLIRQVMMSWGCLLHSRLQKRGQTRDAALSGDGQENTASVSFEIDWMDCAKGQKWRCWNSTKCVPCGPRSGAFDMAIVLTDGSDSIEATNSSHHKRNKTGPWTKASATANSAVITQGTLWAAGDSLAGLQLSPRDVIVVEAGVHGSSGHSITNAVLKIAELIHEIDKGVIEDQVSSAHRKMPNIIHMVTWAQHYPTPTGAFDRAFLKNHTVETGSKECVDSVGDDRFHQEMKALNISFMDCGKSNANPKGRRKQCPRRTLMSYLSGVLWLDGINSRGRSKVGSHVGEFGDCTHFCMPGPTDDIAKALELMIFQILQEEQQEENKLSATAVAGENTHKNPTASQQATK